MALVAKRTLGGIWILEVNANPNGDVVAPKGSIAIDSQNSKMYVNVNGNTQWSKVK